jgi:hypothetical protein
MVSSVLRFGHQTNRKLKRIQFLSRDSKALTTLMIAMLDQLKTGKIECVLFEIHLKKVYFGDKLRLHYSKEMPSLYIWKVNEYNMQSKLILQELP